MVRELFASSLEAPPGVCVCSAHNHVETDTDPYSVAMPVIRSRYQAKPHDAEISNESSRLGLVENVG